MGVQNGAASMKTSMEFPQNISSRISMGSSNPSLECFSKRMEVRISRDISAAMSLMALFTRAEVEAPENAPTPELWC